MIVQAAGSPIRLEKQLRSLLDIARGDGSGCHGILVVRLLDSLGREVELETHIGFRAARSLDGVEVVREVVTQNRPVGIPTAPTLGPQKIPRP